MQFCKVKVKYNLSKKILLDIFLVNKYNVNNFGDITDILKILIKRMCNDKTGCYI